MFCRIRIRPKIFFTDPDPDPGAEKIPDPPGSGSATLVLKDSLYVVNYFTENTFRGYPLDGERLKLPEGYKGLVLDTGRKGISGLFLKHTLNDAFAFLD